MVVALVAWLLLASMAGTQWQQDFNSLKAINIQGKLVLLKKPAQQDLGPQHFNVLAFPCNQCGQQKPDSNKIDSFAPLPTVSLSPCLARLQLPALVSPLLQKYLEAPDGKVVGAWDPSMTVEEIRPQVTALVMKLILKKQEDL
ncbi:hypothetical protein FD755_025633 [Muntiacus reevesi]|uniref:Uncharacterized protein n=1 Tax=Muntiacus reevesi TaxID=9886 RepID=A0A5N3UL67_MUNRE|nr:hypothetical protein FD755_025633 [Muntiacus reevesi]